MAAFSSSTAILARTHRISFDLRSEAGSGYLSTSVGDHEGIGSAVGSLFASFFFLLPSFFFLPLSFFLSESPNWPPTRCALGLLPHAPVFLCHEAHDVPCCRAMPCPCRAVPHTARIQSSPVPVSAHQPNPVQSSSSLSSRAQTVSSGLFEHCREW